MKHQGETFFAGGTAVRLGRRIGKGGEGEVFLIEGQPGQALKLYSAHVAKDREAKINAMVRAGLASGAPAVAFPRGVAQAPDGSFAGFVMSLVSDHKPLHELYAPGPRKLHFPKADYRFLVRVAYNIMGVASAVHHSGCVIGDINHSGILISERATVAFIDADSFQFTDGRINYLCRVGVPEYTPPELIGRKLDGITRTQNHDSFGLGVVLFQLLCMGRHPFTGTFAKGDLSPADAISQFRFAYSRQRNVDLRPPPGACRLEDFPTALGVLFETAFGPSGPRLRPTAQQWLDAIDELQKGLRSCGASQLHHYSSAATECPWCRMEKATQTRLFVDPKANLGAGPTWQSIFDETAFRAQLASVPLVNNFSFNLGPMAAGGRSTAAPAQQNPPGSSLKKIGWWVTAGGVAVLLFGSESSPDAAGFGMAVAAVGGAMLLWSRFLGYKDGPQQAELKNLDDRLRERLERLMGEADLDAAHLAHGRIHGLLADRRTLLQQRQSEEDRFKRDHEEASLNEFLDKFLIASAKIDGIGPANVSALRSWGIETATDIRRHNVRDVSGIGKVKAEALNTWSRKMAGRFQGSQAPSPSQQADLRRRLEGVNQKIRANEELLNRELGRYKEISNRIESLRNVRDPEFQAQLRRRVELADEISKIRGASFVVSDLSSRFQKKPRETTLAEADRMRRGSIVPAAPISTPYQAPLRRPPLRPAGTQTVTPKCPQCGSPMLKRLASRGRNSGSFFWGCTRFPTCKGTRNI